MNDGSGAASAGALREAVAALRNLVRLLQSKSIGPRELSRIFRELERESQSWLGDPTTDEAPARVRTFLEELTKSARHAVDRSHRAKIRLEIEQDFRRLSGVGEELLAELNSRSAGFS